MSDSSDTYVDDYNKYVDDVELGDHDGDQASAYRHGQRLPSKAKSKPIPTTLSVEKRDRAYRILLERLPLHPEHKTWLNKQGVTDADIERGVYRTWDVRSVDKRKSLLDEIGEAIGEDNVPLLPGVVPEAKGLWALHWVGDGILFPVRNSAGLVLGLRIRYERTKDGKTEKQYPWLSSTDAGSGSHVHHPMRDPAIDVTTVYITEGERKADIATWKTNRLYLSVPGVWQYRGGLEAAIALGAKRIVVAFDCDMETNHGVAECTLRLVAETLKRGLEVSLDTWPMSSGKGIDDVIIAGKVSTIQTLTGNALDAFLEGLARKHGIDRGDQPTIAEVTADVAEEPVAPVVPPLPVTPVVPATPPAPATSREWEKKLLRTRGKMRHVASNVEIALREAPYLAGAIGYDEFANVPVWLRPPPWSKQYVACKGVTRGTPWSDQDDIRLSYLLASIGLDVSTRTVRDAVDIRSRESTFHPVRDYVNSITWDGVNRLDKWLVTYCGADDTDYTHDVGRWWPMQAAARILTPGAKGDYTLILEGKQDIGKSKLAKILGGQWFSDSFFDIANKESLMQLEGVWIYELPEGEIFTRSSVQRLKGFLTQCENSYVPKFSNRKVKVPRETTFILTVNESEYLLDPTGNRRFWPVKVRPLKDGFLDAVGLAAVRDQLWAEAVHRVRAGETYWPTTKDEVERCKAAEMGRRVLDPWHETIAEYVESKAEITVEELLESALKVEIRTQEQRDRLRVVRILTTLGWTQRESRPLLEGRRIRVYDAPNRDTQKVAAQEISLAESEVLRELNRHGWVSTLLPDGRRVLTQPVAVQSDCLADIGNV